MPVTTYYCERQKKRGSFLLLFFLFFSFWWLNARRLAPQFSCCCRCLFIFCFFSISFISSWYTQWMLVFFLFFFFFYLLIPTFLWARWIVVAYSDWRIGTAQPFVVCVLNMSRRRHEIEPSTWFTPVSWPKSRQQCLAHAKTMLLVQNQSSGKYSWSTYRIRKQF